jgi:hypothetical protein
MWLLPQLAIIEGLSKRHPRTSALEIRECPVHITPALCSLASLAYTANRLAAFYITRLRHSVRCIFFLISLLTATIQKEEKYNVPRVPYPPPPRYSAQTALPLSRGITPSSRGLIRLSPFSVICTFTAICLFSVSSVLPKP